MTHVFDPAFEPPEGENSIALFLLRPLCGQKLSEDDLVVVCTNAMDPVILAIDCPECAAIISYELRLEIQKKIADLRRSL